MATPDVTVLGAGIFGLSVAWACLARGARVQVIDPGGPGAGASGGIVGALAPHVPENWNAKKAFQLESLLSAEGFWAQVDDASGQTSGYARTGRLQPLPDDSAAVALAEQRAGGARELWAGRAEWRVVETSDVPSPTGRCIHDTLTARIYPRWACESLASAIRMRGGSVTADGAETGAVVHATGADGLRVLADWFDAPFGVGVKGQAVLLGSGLTPDTPQVFADGLHIVPHADGTVAIGSTTEREWAIEGPEIEVTETLRQRAVAALPCLRDAKVVARWAGVRPRARTRAPVLGPWPDRPGHFVANGGFKIGFGMAPKVADVMADLILEGTDTIPPGFRVEDCF
ncbi:MAG: FAD-binding oxidoreductase [Pseudomonadota bacterium]